MKRVGARSYVLYLLYAMHGSEAQGSSSSRPQAEGEQNVTDTQATPSTGSTRHASMPQRPSTASSTEFAYQESVLQLRDPSAGRVRYQQRNPPVFWGRQEEDVADWLRQFERCAAYNYWNDHEKVSVFPMFLGDSADHWYTALRTIPQTWSEFSREFFS